MGTLLFRNAVFWRPFMMIFFLLSVAGIGKAEDLKKCDDLDRNSPKNDFLSCAEIKMKIKEFNGSYPVADFSNFTQDNLNNIMIVKTGHGTPDSDNPDRLFGGNFQVKNSNITNIRIGFYVPSSSLPQSFVLENNWNLEKVTITKFKEVEFLKSMQFIISNNKRLSRASIEGLKAQNYTSNDSYIQDFGECSLNQNGISSLEDLEDCHYTVNDLVINRKTVLAATNTLDLKEIKGCIRIENTELKDLNVISTITNTSCSGSHEIVNNKNLCLHPEEISKLKKRLGKVDYKNNSDCLKNCSAHYFLSEKDPLCENIKGDLEITGFNDVSDLDYFNKIVSIEGHIKVHNNNIQEIPFLKTLQEVGNGCESGPAIDIFDNPSLTEVDLTSLKTVACPYLNVWLRVKDNSSKLSFSLQRMIELSQEGLVQIPVDHAKGSDNLRHVKQCQPVCDSRYQSTKDLCCVHNGYLKFFGCVLEDYKFKAYCLV